MLAQEIKSESPNAVGFRRFIYDPEVGRRFLDKGWVYFTGDVVSKEDILSPSSYARNRYNHLITPTLISNVECNGFDILFLEGGHAWPFNRDKDLFVEC